ncbi:hypothetical protein AcV7_004425 [Taiwanofungus camphoratus]|nr:hypothetical protein AcV7_004425 [Antrodia cinnamomea]
MLFSVARLRLALASAALFFSFSQAREEVLFASSVSYCTPPEEILVEQLDVTYFRSNNSISFNVSAASILPNVNVSANVYLNVYGLQPVNYTINLCSLFDGILCPLPQYNFTGSDSLPIPSSVDITSKIPGIAYKIPNLEAFAQISLIEVSTNQVKACVQATLSNGWSARQKGVEWTTAAMALLALASAIWQSVVADALALAPIRLLDLIYLFQTIAVSGLLGLDYPSIYTYFTLNFAWVLGLFAASPSSPIQNSINSMRHRTGGNLADASTGGAVPLVNRKLSPYNFGGSSSTFSVSQSLLARFASLPHVNLANAGPRKLVAAALNRTAVLVTGNVETVTSESSNVLEAGIPIYVNSIGIATANAFMTIFLITLIYAAVVLGALALGYAAFLGLGHVSWGRQRTYSYPGLKLGYLPFARAWGLRAALCTVIPVLVFAFYQWTLKDSWLSVLLSVILLLIILALILPPVFFVLRPHLPYFLSRTRETTASASPSLVPLTAPFLPGRIYYIVLIAVAMLVKALVTAFASSHGLVQAIISLVVDVLLLAAIVLMKPHRTRHADILQGYLAITRVVTSGLLIALGQSLALAAIPRVVIGCIVGVLFSIAVVVMFLDTLVNMGVWRLVKRGLPCGRRRKGDRALASNASQSGSDSSVLEKAGGERDAEKLGHDTPGYTPGSSQHYFHRPENPTPPTSGSLTPVSPESVQYSPSTSTSTTLGEPLPRRWSFQHSPPPSATMSPSSGSYVTTSRRGSVTPSPVTPVSGLPSTRHSRHPSASAPQASPIMERCSFEGRAL